MDESRSSKVTLVLAFCLTFAVAGVAQQAQNPSSSAQGDDAQKKAVQEKEAKQETTPPTGKSVDTSPKVVKTPSTVRSSSPLVEAANAAKANKQKPRIVIDNNDVRNSTGKITVLKPRADIHVPDEGTREKLEKEKAALDAVRQKANERMENARKTMEELEKELARLEEEYYTEADLDYRDDVIEERFNETKAQLDKAREELSSARDEMQEAELAKSAPAEEKPPPE